MGATTTPCPDNEWHLPGVHGEPPERASISPPLALESSTTTDVAPSPDCHEAAVLAIASPSVVTDVLAAHLADGPFLELTVDVNTDEEVDKFIDESLWDNNVTQLKRKLK